jgi:hypothetical protein
MTNGNFYDNVLAYYSLYYRTGLDTYLEYARTLADRWWQMPWMDEGRAGMYMWPRNVALTGMALRALERGDMWDGMRKMWDHYRSVVTTPVAPNDIRERGYEFLFVAQCAMVDPDETHRLACVASLRDSFARKWLPARVAKPGDVMDGAWGISMFYVNHSAWYDHTNPTCTVNVPCGTVTVTNGSNIVVGNNTDWKRSWLESATFDDGKSTQYFWAADKSSTGDKHAYLLTGCAPGKSGCPESSIIDATHLRLPRPYEGPTRTTKWAISNFAGFGVQPFMLGILSTAFFTGYDATGDSGMRDAAVTLARWIATHGVQSSTKGLYYFRGLASCQEPTPTGPLAEPQPGCAYDPSSAAAVRFLTGEVMSAMARAYEATGDASIRTTGNMLYTAAFAKPGWLSPYPSDGIYINTYDSFSMTANKNKDLGFWYGMGFAARWPAAAPATTVVAPPTAPPSVATVDTTPPSAPTNLLAVNIARESFDVRWSPCADNTGVAGYLIDVALDVAFTRFVYHDAPSLVTSYAAIQLKRDTPYYVRVRATDAMGNVSAYSTVLPVRTSRAGSKGDSETFVLSGSEPLQ